MADAELVCKIRHEFTNYDRLSSFYHVWRKYRSALNRVITMLINEQIDIPEFRERVAQIESKVDLTRPKNQKKYLKQRRDAMCRAPHTYTIDAANRIAKSNLASILQLQRAINDGRMRDDLFETFDKTKWERGRKVPTKKRHRTVSR